MKLALTYGARPGHVVHNVRYHGYIDWWAPALHGNFDEATREALNERRRRYGERFGFYVCSGFRFQNPYSATRILPWVAFAYDADHFLNFRATGGWHKTDPDPDKRFPAVPYEGHMGHELVYPGLDFELYPSIRLSSMRDGMEEYELLRLLRDRCRYMVPEVPEHKALLAEAESLLDIDALLRGADYRRWQFIADALDLSEHRGRVARMIKSMNAAIAAYPERLTKPEK